MTKIPFTECQMEEGMRKAEAQRPVSHTHTHPLPLMQAAPWAASLSFCSAAGIRTNIHFPSRSKVTTPRGQNPRGPTQDLPRGRTDRGHLTRGGETCVGGQQHPQGRQAMAILGPEVSN